MFNRVVIMCWWQCGRVNGIDQGRCSDEWCECGRCVHRARSARSLVQGGSGWSRIVWPVSVGLVMSEWDQSEDIVELFAAVSAVFTVDVVNEAR